LQSREDSEWSRELLWKRGGIRNERSARPATDLDLAAGKIAAGVSERPMRAREKCVNVRRKSASEYRNRGYV